MSERVELLLKLYCQWFYDWIMFRVIWFNTVKFDTYSTAVKGQARRSVVFEDLWCQPAAFRMQNINLFTVFFWFSVNFCDVYFFHHRVIVSMILCLFCKTFSLKLIYQISNCDDVLCFHHSRLWAFYFFTISTNLDSNFVQWN